MVTQTHQTNRHCQFIVCLILYLFCGFSNAQPLLEKRYSIHQEFNRELFIVELSTTPAATENQLLNGKIAFAFDMAITTENLSSRRFRRLWLEGLSINLASDQLTQHSSSLSQFSSLLQIKLEQGDHLLLSYSPENGSRLQLNQGPEFQFPTHEFAPALLSALLGNIPLSTDFKNQLVTPSNQNRSIAAAFKALSPQNDRLSLALITKVDPSVTTAKISTPQSTPIEVVKPALSPAPTVKKEIKKPVADLSTKPKVEKPLDSPRADDNRALADKNKATTTHSNSDDLDVKEPALVKTSPSLTNPEADAEEETDDFEFTEKTLALHQAYFAKLIREANKYKTIPYQAFQRRWEGYVKVQITIDQNGYLLAADIISPAKYDLFNEQAMTAIKKAEPFSKIPKELSVNNFTFTAPFDYRFAP